VYFATLIANRSRKINLGDAARELEGANLDPVRHGIRQPARCTGTGQQSPQYGARQVIVRRHPPGHGE
jgi:hypothetical protein